MTQRPEPGAANQHPPPHFYYGNAIALKNINLDIFKGKVTAFIGPSGCGKSTLLRAINRMYDLYPTSGRGELFHRRPTSWPAASTCCAARQGRHGFPETDALPMMSIYDNIAFGVKMHEKLSRTQMDDRVEWALTKAALWGRSRTSSRVPAPAFPAASSSACASPAAWR